MIPDTFFGKLIVIAGPTAIGKSGTAVRLAKEIGGEIISADSMQVYRGMDIGTAKVSADEMQGVPHHLIDIVDVNTDFNAAMFKEYALEACRGIYARKRIPIVCGGTGFYIQALLYDIDFSGEPERDEAYRDSLWALAEEKGGEAVFSLLSACDPETAAVIDRHNTKRVIRALEYHRLHGGSMAVHNREEAQKRAASPFDCRFYVLHGDRKAMYERIDARVDRMLADGLFAEALRLEAAGLRRNSTAAQGIGYREIYEYLDSCAAAGTEPGTELPVTVADRIKADSRHYAKRQVTWFRREKNAVWIDIDRGDPPDAIMADFSAAGFTT